MNSCQYHEQPKKDHETIKHINYYSVRVPFLES